MLKKSEIIVLVISSIMVAICIQGCSTQKEGKFTPSSSHGEVSEFRIDYDKIFRDRKKIVMDLRSVEPGSSKYFDILIREKTSSLEIGDLVARARILNNNLPQVDSITLARDLVINVGYDLAMRTVLENLVGESEFKNFENEFINLKAR